MRTPPTKDPPRTRPARRSELEDKAKGAGHEDKRVAAGPTEASAAGDVVAYEGEASAQGAAVKLVQAARPAELRYPETGVLGEAGPRSMIFVHTLARDPGMAEAFVQALLEDFGPAVHIDASAGYHGPRGSMNPRCVWLRDFCPSYVRTPEGAIKGVMALAPDEERSAWSPGRTWQSPDGSRHRYPGPRYGVDGPWIAHERMPIIHENGNLVRLGQHVALTELILKDNQLDPDSHPLLKHLRGAGYVPRDRDAIVQILSEQLGVPRGNIQLRPPMPGDATQHIDQFVMDLGDNTVLVPEIREEALQAISYGHEIELGDQVRAHLDHEAALYQHLLGVRVVRLPMLAPVFLQPAPELPGGWKGVFYTPTQMRLLEVGGKRRAYIPTWDPVGFPEPYRELNRRYQREWQAFAEQRGFTPRLIDAGSLARTRGLFRCLTFEVPELGQA